MNPLIEVGMSLIDRFFPDKAEADKRKIELLAMQQAGELKKLDSVMQVITTEAKSDHFIVAAWRPITMLVFVFIIANNYIIYPYLSLFWDSAPSLTIPTDLWDLLKLGLGGYVAGRTGEKMMKSWKEK